jgi:hypothetical protein
VAYHHQPVYDTEYTPATALGALWNIRQRGSRCVVMSGLSLAKPRVFTLPESAGAVNRADCRALTVTLIRGL